PAGARRAMRKTALRPDSKGPMASCARTPGRGSLWRPSKRTPPVGRVMILNTAPRADDAAPLRRGKHVACGASGAGVGRDARRSPAESLQADRDAAIGPRCGERIAKPRAGRDAGMTFS